MSDKTSRQAFSKIKALPKEIVEAIDGKLMSGDPALAVAKYLQDDAKVFLSDDLYNLKKLLERYRKSDLQKRVAERIFQTTKTQATSALAKRVNAMDELNDLIRIQRDRVALICSREALAKESKILLKDATRELQVLEGMLVNLARLQLETGWIPKAPKNFKGSIANPDGTVTEFEWTEEQEQLYSDLEAIRASQEARAPD